MEKAELGSMIRKVRLMKGYTQEVLAEKADIGLMYYGEIERGVKMPSMKPFIDPVLGIGIADNMFEENETGEIWIEEPKIKEKNGLIFADVKYHSRRA